MKSWFRVVYKKEERNGDFCYISKLKYSGISPVYEPKLMYHLNVTFIVFFYCISPKRQN